MSEDIFEIFGLTAKPKAELNNEHLAETTVETLEITINFPQSGMTLLEHIQVYKDLWQELKTEFKPIKDLYFIEYCKTGQAHIHGYLQVNVHANTYSLCQFDDSLLLKMFVKPIFKNLPKKYWIQYTKKHTIDNYLRRFKSPAVCLNLKNYLSTNWVDYISKNAPKK